MQIFSTLARHAITLFPLYLWALVAVGLVYAVPDYGWFDTSREHTEFLVLIAPAITWMIVATLDALELFEFDGKGGRLNFVIGWIVVLVAMFGGPTFLSEGSSAPVPALVLMSILSVIQLIKWRMRPGELREAIDREINLMRYGTTWRPAKTKDHGSARLGDVRKAAKYYQEGDIIFGTAKPHLPEADSLLAKVVRACMRWREPKLPPILRGSWNGHGLICSGSGGGKSVSFVVGNCLTYSAGSLVCIDPKSEIHAITARARREQGHDVYKLKPGDLDTDSFNAIGWIEPGSSTFTRDCMTVASWIFPDSGGGDDGASYYAETAKRLFAFTLAYKISRWGIAVRSEPDAVRPTLTDIYNFLFRSPTEISDEIQKIYDHLKEAPDTLFGAATPQIKTWAGSFVGGDSERTWPNTISSVQKNFWWIGDPSISSVVSGTPRAGGKGSAFQAKDINNGKTSIFLCIPLSVLEATPGLARLIVGAFLNAIFAAEGKTRGSTLFMIDEMQILGNFPILHQTALNQGRGYGINLMGIIQTPEALDKQAGDKTFDAWVDNTMLQVYFAIGGAETAERISTQIGEATVEHTSYSGQVAKNRGQVLGADSGGVNISKERHSRRVKTAAEIMDLDRSYAVVFRRVGIDKDPDVGKLPMIVGTCYYKARPELMALADPNPFERKDVDEEIQEEILQLAPPENLPADEASGDFQEGTQPDPEKPVVPNMDHRETGEWGATDPREFLERNAARSPRIGSVLEALDALENNETLSEEQGEVLQQLLSGAAQPRYGDILDDLDLDDVLEGFAPLVPASPLEREEAKMRAVGEREERKQKALIAAKAVHESMPDDEAAELVKAQLETIARLTAEVDSWQRERTA